MTGASIGIGRATALLAAQKGHAVAVHYHTHAREADEVVAEITGTGGSAFSARADLASEEGPRTLARAVGRQWDSLDGAVLNAGVYSRGAFADLTDSDWEDCFDVNVLGPARLVRELLPRLRASDRPSVVFISSVLAFTGSTHGAHYAAAKAAIEGLSYSLARELAPGIRVNAVAPGSIDTAILAGDSPERRAERGRSIPLGRIGRPEEVAEAVVFLLGPGSSYITGSTLHVNGGLRTS
ncbi:MAG: SDR family oxidoreductase [Thermoplasmata archaeon]|nr:SDR family oxidoreductase [Thermoplasmata archaeon]